MHGAQNFEVPMHRHKGKEIIIVFKTMEYNSIHAV